MYNGSWDLCSSSDFDLVEINCSADHSELICLVFFGIANPTSFSIYYLMRSVVSVCVFGCLTFPAAFSCPVSLKSSAHRKSSTFNRKTKMIPNEIHFKWINTTWNWGLFNSALRDDLGWQGWPWGMHTRLEAVLPGFESWPSYKLSSQCFTGRVIHQCVCCPSDGR